MHRLFIFMVALISQAQGAFFNEHASGWHWYEDKQIEPLEEPEVSEVDRETIGRQEKKKSQTPTEILNAFKKEAERRLHVAILNPTPFNLKHYQLIQKQMVDRAERFGKAWMEVVYTNPELDYTIKNPISQVGRHIQLDDMRQKRDRMIKALSKEYGLFFFFKGDCSYCHAFAPIVKQFSQTYGWSVMAVSLDGSTLPDFPLSQPNNGMAQQLDITVYPTLIAVQPQTGEIIPISFGLSTMDQMIERIELLTQRNPNND